MTIEERIEKRIAELDELITTQDRNAMDALKRHDRSEAAAHRDMARGYAQAKLELVRLRTGVTP